MDQNRRKALYAMMALIIVFGCVFMVALANLFRGQAIFGIGVGPAIENWITMAFSFAAIIRMAWEIFLIERG